MRRMLLVAVLAALLVAPVARAWTWPVGGPVLQPFSFDPVHPYAAGEHRGIDIGAGCGRSRACPGNGHRHVRRQRPRLRRVWSRSPPLTGFAVTLTHLGSIVAAASTTVAEGDVGRRRSARAATRRSAIPMCISASGSHPILRGTATHRLPARANTHASGARTGSTGRPGARAAARRDGPGASCGQHAGAVAADAVHGPGRPSRGRRTGRRPSWRPLRRPRVQQGSGSWRRSPTLGAPHRCTRPLSVWPPSGRAMSSRPRARPGRWSSRLPNGRGRGRSRRRPLSHRRTCARPMPSHAPRAAPTGVPPKLRPRRLRRPVGSFRPAPRAAPQ